METFTNIIDFDLIAGTAYWSDFKQIVFNCHGHGSKPCVTNQGLNTCATDPYCFLGTPAWLRTVGTAQADWVSIYNQKSSLCWSCRLELGYRPLYNPTFHRSTWHYTIWNSARSWTPFSRKKMSCLYYMVNTTVAADLAVQGITAPAHIL